MKSLCGTRDYQGIDRQKMARLLKFLTGQESEAVESGEYLLKVDSQNVKLMLAWVEKTQVLTIEIVSKPWFIPCSRIWQTIDLVIESLHEKTDGADAANVCGQKCYPNIDKAKINKMLKALRDAGHEVSGDNPWTVKIKHWTGTITLVATWNESQKEICMIVQSKPGVVPCHRIWSTIDELIRQLDVAETEAALATSVCGTRSYPNITQAKVEAMIKALRDNGATVTGNNPYDVDTHRHGVKLRASRNATNNVLTVEVTAKAWFVPCGRIWSEIEKYLPHVSSITDEDLG